MHNLCQNEDNCMSVVIKSFFERYLCGYVHKHRLSAFSFMHTKLVDEDSIQRDGCTYTEYNARSRIDAKYLSTPPWLLTKRLYKLLQPRWALQAT